MRKSALLAMVAALAVASPSGLPEYTIKEVPETEDHPAYKYVGNYYPPIPQLPTNGDSRKHLREIIIENGFVVEEYFIETEDNYVLHVFRIPRAENETMPSTPKPVVLFQHGLDACATTWAMNWAWKSPAFMMSMAGYDVWLNNNRANYYSCNNTRLDPKNKKDKPAFYDYDWEDLGSKDQPPVIDFILDKTGNAQLTFVGHSQGTTQMFAALPDMMDYFRSKVNLFVALAPPTKMSPMPDTWLTGVAKNEKLIVNIAVKALGQYNIFPRSYEWVTSPVCNALPWLCDLFIKQIIEDDPKLDDPDRRLVSYSHFPSGASYRCTQHYAQNINAGAFRKYNYGSAKKNKAVYGTETPPDYDISKITDFPIGIFVGTEDKLATKGNAEWLRDTLPKGTVVFYKEYLMGHSTFLLGIDVSYFDDVIALVKKYNPLN